jgi:hypothetical protein
VSVDALRATAKPPSAVARASARASSEPNQVAPGVALDLGSGAVGGVCGDAGASMLAELMPSLAKLDRESVIQFFRLLSHHLGFDGSVTCRVTEARLGLLVTLAGRGELPPVSRYEEARSEELQVGREWPGASRLSLTYGGYPRAVEAAVRYLSSGRSDGRQVRPRGPRQRYSREEILTAIESCRRALLSPDSTEHGDQDWYPDPPTFFLWNRIGREIARKTGRPDPRLPDREALRRWFASYEEAVEACRRKDRLQRLAPARDAAKPRPRRPRSNRIRV